MNSSVFLFASFLPVLSAVPPSSFFPLLYRWNVSKSGRFVFFCFFSSLEGCIFTTVLSVYLIMSYRLNPSRYRNADLRLFSISLVGSQPRQTLRNYPATGKDWWRATVDRLSATSEPAGGLVFAVRSARFKKFVDLSSLFTWPWMTISSTSLREFLAYRRSHCQSVITMMILSSSDSARWRCRSMTFHARSSKISHSTLLSKTSTRVEFRASVRMTR